MMRITFPSKLLLLTALVIAAVACGDSVAEMLVPDAGADDADAGDAGVDADDAGVDVEVVCNKEAPHPNEVAGDLVHWAEFEIPNPGQTEVTHCWKRSEVSYNPGVVLCHRGKATWIRGTNTGFLYCGQTIDGVWAGKPVSITVHE